MITEGRLICADNSIWIRVLVDIDDSLVSLVTSWIRDGVAQVAPALLHYEFSHVVTRYVRNRKLAATHGADLLDELLALNIEAVDDDDLHRRALAYSMSHPGLSGYDAQYLAVSERTGAELWTADKGLAAVSQRLGISPRLWVSGLA